MGYMNNIIGYIASLMGYMNNIMGYIALFMGFKVIYSQIADNYELNE